jgi:hypothetical protein
MEISSPVLAVTMSLESDFLIACETHSPKDIAGALTAGMSPTALIHGKTPIDSLIESYLRSTRFADCLRVLLSANAPIDPLLKSLLLDDDTALRQLLSSPGNHLVQQRMNVPSAFTSLQGVTPLHVCAEYNSVRCAGALLDTGADINAPADIDTHGVGGHTPIYHAVNSIFNFCRPTLELLVERGADLNIRVNALHWGPGADWETIVFDASPVSYAQCGLYAQFHRKEPDIYSNLAYLYEKKHGAPLPLRNVPNKYLAPRPSST